MAQILKTSFDVDAASSILDDLQTQKSRYYYFIGRTKSWGDPDVPGENYVGNATCCARNIRSEITAVKRITSNDASLVVRNIPWTSGVVYSFWNARTDMSELDFYVYTTDHHVYKCLDNGNGAASTVMPTGTPIKPIRTSDGYVWKYMYTVASAKRQKFVSQDWLPVQTAIGESFYSNGEIAEAVVLAEGTGYVANSLVTLDVTGTTTGDGATLSVTVSSTGVITNVDVVSGGSGYTSGAKIKIDTPNTGFGAVLTPVIEDGVITSVLVEDGGGGYQPTTTASVIVGGAVLLPIVNDEDGSIAGVYIEDAGAGYSGTVSVSINSTSGTGIYGNADAVIEAFVYDGSIVSAYVIDPGIGYPTDLSTYIAVQGDGTGAKILPVISEGRIIDAIVASPGSGYTNATLVVTSSSGSGARVSATLGTIDLVSRQSYVEQSASTYAGSIYKIVVTAGGEGYTPATTTVTILGNGTGCVATANVVNGSIESINIVGESYGRDYTNAIVVIEDPSRQNINNELDDAQAYAIIPPVGGHGSNALEELFATRLLFSSTINVNDERFAIPSNSYRTYGVIKNPRNFFDRSTFTGVFEFQGIKTRFSSTTSLLEGDELVTSDRNKFLVINIENDIVWLLPIDKQNISPVGTLTNIITETTYSSLEVLGEFPTFDKYSGSMLFASTSEPFELSSEQSITLKSLLNL